MCGPHTLFQGVKLHKNDVIQQSTKLVVGLRACFISIIFPRNLKEQPITRKSVTKYCKSLPEEDVFYIYIYKQILE